MTNETLENHKDETYSKPRKKIYPTKKVDVYHIDDIWSLDILDLNVYGSEKIRERTYLLVVIDTFIKFGWTIPMRNKNAQTRKDCFETILPPSRTKPNLFETDRGTEFPNNIFRNFFKNNTISHYSRISSLGAVLTERFNRTIRDLP